jgi:hypothetical protein
MCKSGWSKVFFEAVPMRVVALLCETGIPKIAGLTDPSYKI